MSLSLDVHLPGADHPRLRRADVAIFGEVHGTAETPPLVARYLERCEDGSPLLLGLEIPTDERDRLDRYLASHGRAHDRNELLSGPFWNGLPDGRTSVAMLELIEDIRKKRRQGCDLEIVAFDSAPHGPARERDMAETLVARFRQGEYAQLVVLVGNLHARRTRGVPWDPEWTPMAAHMVEKLEVVTLDFRSASGEAWNCRNDPPDCGPHPLPGRDRGRDVFIDVEASSDPSRLYDGIFYIGRPNASPPAGRASGSPVEEAIE